MIANGEITVTLPRLHPAQETIANDSRRFNVIRAGRRFGKNYYGHRRIVKRALKMAQPVAWCAPSYRMLLDDWNEVKNIVYPVTAQIQSQEKRITLIGGSWIDFWSLDNADSIRGKKYGHIVNNEVAQVKGFTDIWEQIQRLTLADYHGGADFYSTPRGLNDFYHLWNIAGDDPNWSRHHYTTYDNPYIDPTEIDAMKESLPEKVFQQEILAEFLEDGAYFQRVNECAVIEHPDEPEQHKDHAIFAGLDWALSNDFTVLTIVCRNCNRAVDWDRFNQIDFTYQRARIIERCQRWAGLRLLPERNSIGQPNIELLREYITIISGPDYNPGFNTSATTKPALIQRLASGLEHGGFQVPLEYADELRSYQVEFTGSGATKFSAPSGYHDDRVISLALAYWAITGLSAASLIDFA